MHSILRLGSFELNPLPKEEDERAKRAQERRERGREGERARFLWEGGPESPEACDASFPRFCFCLSLLSPPPKGGAGGSPEREAAEPPAPRKARRAAKCCVDCAPEAAPSSHVTDVFFAEPRSAKEKERERESADPFWLC